MSQYLAQSAIFLRTETHRHYELGGWPQRNSRELKGNQYYVRRLVWLLLWLLYLGQNVTTVMYGKGLVVPLTCISIWLGTHEVLELPVKGAVLWGQTIFTHFHWCFLRNLMTKSSQQMSYGENTLCHVDEASLKYRLMSGLTKQKLRVNPGGTNGPEETWKDKRLTHTL